MGVIYEDDQVRVEQEFDAAAQCLTTRSVPKPGSEEHNKQQIRAQIDQAIGRIELDAADDATWNSLSNNRRAQTTRLAVFLVAKLARLVLGKVA